MNAKPNGECGDLLPVLQRQLGLKLENGRGPKEFLVIAHVEKPSSN
jgi:uncharacterized protein (TIGR03435 family)